MHDNTWYLSVLTVCVEVDEMPCPDTVIVTGASLWPQNTVSMKTPFYQEINTGNVESIVMLGKIIRFVSRRLAPVIICSCYLTISTILIWIWIDQASSPLPIDDLPFGTCQTASDCLWLCLFLIEKRKGKERWLNNSCQNQQHIITNSRLGSVKFDAPECPT